jgi:hypothetical protein
MTKTEDNGLTENLNKNIGLRILAYSPDSRQSKPKIYSKISGPNRKITEKGKIDNKNNNLKVLM